MKTRYKMSFSFSWGFLLRLFLGLGLLGFLLWRLDIIALLQYVKSVPYWMALALVGLSSCQILLQALLTSQMLKPIGRLSLLESLKVNLGTLAMGYMLPARLGVLAGRPVLLKSALSPKPDLAKAAGVMLLEILPESFRFALVGLIALILLSQNLSSELILVLWPSVLAYWGFCLVVALASVSQRLYQFTKKAAISISCFLGLNSIKYIQNFLDRIFDIMARAQTGSFELFQAKTRFALTGFAMISKTMILQGIQLWLLLSLSPQNIPWWICLVLPSLAYSVSVLPISLSGIGVAEGAGALILSALGIDFEFALLVIMLDRISGVYLPVLAGALILPSFNLKADSFKKNL